MRVVHLIASLALETGGPARACIDMARATARKGHEVSVLTTNYGMENQDLDLGQPMALGDGASVIHFPVHRPRFWKASLPMARAATVQNIRRMLFADLILALRAAS